jgi:hypothetical protein
MKQDAGAARRIYYTLHSGKNSKLAYYIAGTARTLVPKWLLRSLLRGRLASLQSRADRDYILDRVGYYCKLDAATSYDHYLWRDKSVRVADQQKGTQKVYYLDAMRYARWFPQTLRWRLETGDVAWKLDVPSVTKSRPVCDDNQCSVLLKLNEVRHYIYVNDRKLWREKKDMAVFRGGITGERRLKMRKPFVERWFGHKMFDIGVINREFPEWHTPKMTIAEQLGYKFIMALEGNDVASNLKWVMSSNSIAVMPRPEMETWFMEGRLVPDYHYIEIKPDFSDVEERLTHYINHPEEAEAIIRHAHEWVSQFRDTRRETLISLLVLDKYFKATNVCF